MIIYTVLSYSYSGDDHEVYVETHKSFKSKEAANQYLLKMSSEVYTRYYNDDDYFDYTCGVGWALISNEEHFEDPYDIYYRYFKVTCNDLCEEGIIILNS